jgi:iron complex transport system ATP-binding protein
MIVRGCNPPPSIPSHLVKEENLLQFEDVTVLKGDVAALNRLTLTIRRGEHTAILGPNGSGKTTLINLITHEDRAVARGDDGRQVRVFDHHRWNVFELRARLGIVSANLHQRFVDGNSAGRIRGEDAVVSGLFATHGVVHGLHVTGEMRRRAVDALADVGADHLAGKWLNEMSEGEARRVLIARALINKPSALVLDEPTAGLDLVARKRFLELLRDIARRGTTLVLVTHHVEEIVPEISRVVLLHHGRVAAEGPKSDLLDSARLSALFEAPISLQELDGYYYARVG